MIAEPPTAQPALAIFVLAFAATAVGMIVHMVR
jgi:hypothetical protein